MILSDFSHLTKYEHQPKGTATGGQFATSVNPESTIDLGDIEETPFSYVYSGDVTNVQVGSRTPWDRADSVDHIAPGIAIVETPGHCGVKLSPERNKEIWPELGSSSGWYEEDCEVYIPRARFPEAFVRGERTVDETREIGYQGIIEWFPEKFESAFDRVLEIGESGTKDRATWTKIHENDENDENASRIRAG